MDSINNISAELKHPLVFSNGNLEPIVINNPIVEYRWKTVFVTGVIGFVTFENIIDNEVFNFDIDFVMTSNSTFFRQAAVKSIALDTVDKNFMLHGELIRLHLSQGLDAQGLLLFRGIQKFRTYQDQHQRQ